MSGNPYESYVESQVLGASPVELVELIYRGAIDAIASARTHLASGSIGPRASAITRAMNLVGELVQSLDLEQGGTLAADLRDLYDYILRRLQAANFEQSDAPLAEAERLLTTLAEGWREIAAGQRPAGPAGRYGEDTAGEGVTVSLSF